MTSWTRIFSIKFFIRRACRRTATTAAVTATQQSTACSKKAARSPAERKRIYGRCNLLAEDLPYVPLWWWKNVVVKKPDLQGFVPYPDGDLISFKQVTLH